LLSTTSAAKLVFAETEAAGLVALLTDPEILSDALVVETPPKRVSTVVIYGVMLPALTDCQ